MAGVVPAIHVLTIPKDKGVDARDKPGHDDVVTESESPNPDQSSPRVV